MGDVVFGCEKDCMSSYSGNNKRIAKNTLLLYVRMLFVMAVSLFTSRVVLNALGVENFGIYNVVGGFVAMFTMLSGSFSTSISPDAIKSNASRKYFGVW